MTDKLYYTKGLEVWKSPIRTKIEGGESITLGFHACTASEIIGEDGATAIAALLCLGEEAQTPTPSTRLGASEPVGEIDAGGTLKWFKPPIRKGTVLYAAPGSTLSPDEVECVCKRAVCTYDADFGCGLDRSKERHDV